MQEPHLFAMNVSSSEQFICGLRTDYLRMNSFTAANKGLAIAGGQRLIEALCFLFTFVLADSLVLLNARHRQAPKRWAKY